MQIVLYVFFPVAMFFYFNLPESYEDFMSQKKVCAIFATMVIVLNYNYLLMVSLDDNFAHC